jgi:hypothetical protein
MPGYLVDYAFLFDTNGDQMGSIRAANGLVKPLSGATRG